MINIFTEHTSNRLEYTSEFMAACANLPVNIYTDPSAFSKAEGYTINYSKLDFPSNLQIVPSQLLFASDIRKQDIQHGNFCGEISLSFNGITDPIASIFYFLSRYEEYLPFQPDQHGRFSASSSLQKKLGVLHQVVCDRIVAQILVKLGAPKISNEQQRLNVTFDIDNAFAFKYKPKWRLFLADVKDLISGNKEQLIQRRRVLHALEKDPYDTYRAIEETAQKADQVNVFWLLGNYAKYDKNISWKNQVLQELIKRVSRFSSPGIHPSYASNEKISRVNEEKKRLERILGQPVICSRQHFLRLRFPETYRNLIDIGIMEDFTMGFADDVGFRSGTARPHKWFDLQKNETTSLVLHPFAYMDGTLNEYLTLTPDEAIHTVEALYREIEQFGGNFVCIWHNETIGQNGKWKDWKKVLDFTLTLKETKNE